MRKDWDGHHVTIVCNCHSRLGRFGIRVIHRISAWLFSSAKTLPVFQICEHKWKLFDISNGKWSTYHDANNKIIDEAFWAGETSVRIQFNRKKYTIQFGTMMQVRVAAFDD